MTEQENKYGAPFDGERMLKSEIIEMTEEQIKRQLWLLGYVGADDLSDEEATDKLLAYYGYEFED